MLRAHQDQENRIAHQAGNAKQLPGKTPGALYPKTPLKVPLNDENTTRVFAGKGTIAKGDNVFTKGTGANMMTPAPRTARAPLGNKTTNAKARAAQQTGGGKELGGDLKSTVKPTTTLRQKQAAPQTQDSKLDVHADIKPKNDGEEEIEYCPPPAQDLPYESDILPAHALTFESLKPENMFKGYYEYYYKKLDDNGMTAKEREMAERQQRDFARGDEQIKKDMEEFDWSIGDIPESKDLLKKAQVDAAAVSCSGETKKTGRLPSRPPSTLVARRAASALSHTSARERSISRPQVNSKPSLTAVNKGSLFARKPSLSNASHARTLSKDRPISSATSRNTLGYSRGRSVSEAARPASAAASHQQQSGPRPRPFSRTSSLVSNGSDNTITPARFAQAQTTQDFQKPLGLLSIFTHDKEEEHSDHETVPHFDDSDDDFQLSTDF
ncbi:hypothetical protein QR685DRAFT_126651 [Neurospora intermedia]|uniref:Uncharacterized protein n=1 Tax=Neurospora intermedia TaxID=5142 RepID=A0ABR3CZC5_NEUIN